MYKRQFFNNDVDDYDYYLDNDICTYNHFYFFDDDGDDYDYYLDNDICTYDHFYFFDGAVHYTNFGNLSNYYRVDNFYNYCHFINNAYSYFFFFCSPNY